MAKKKQQTAKQIKKHKPKIRFVESDNLDGPWTEIPNEAIEQQVISQDEARLSNPILNWFVAVDLQTELYDAELKAQTRLSSRQLQMLREKFDAGFTLNDIRLLFERQGLKFEGHGWPFVCYLAKKEGPKVQRNLSRPMTKSKMRRALRMNGDKSFETFAKEHGIYPVGNNRQLWQICLDKMDPATRKKLETA